MLFDSRAALAAAVSSVASCSPASFTGSSDHLVSQAFSFDDPEGNHRVGMNTWQSRGAGPRTPALGLGQVALRLPGSDALLALADRLRVAGVAVQDDGRELVFADPWSNRVRATVVPPARTP